jgi:hypothetical protein
MVKLRLLVFWLLAIVVQRDFLAMEHAQDMFDLNDVVVNADQNNGIFPNTIRLLFEGFLKNSTNKHNGESQSSNPQQAVQHLETQLNKQIEMLRTIDPEMYGLIMDFKKNAELNGKTQQEIEGFIQKNLDQLASINMYQHLYSAQSAKIESDKKKNYELHEVLDNTELVDESTLYHALLYRSAAAPGEKDDVQKEVEKSKGCVADWLETLKKEHPIAYVILTQVFEQVKNKKLNQQDASSHLLNAVNQLTNVDSLLLPMKDVQMAHQKKTIWKQAVGLISAVAGGFTILNISTGGLLGGFLGAKNMTVIACTLGECLALMNVTIG